MSRLENFINNEQFNHYIGYIQEYMNNYSNQQVAYYETIINTKNSAFNETDFNQLDIADPVMINCLVSIETKENKSYAQNQAGRYEEYGNINVWILEKTLKDLKINIKYGDFLAYNIKDKFVFFTVSDSDTKNISNDVTYGAFEPVYKLIKGTPTPEEIFKFL